MGELWTSQASTVIKEAYKGVVGVIPARRGSQRVKRKNVKLLGGKPLVAWTFEEAKRVKRLDRLIVSTDDEEVKRLAEEYGVEVPFFPRPQEICGDVDSGLVLQHAVKFLEGTGYEVKAVVLLQPTSPLRTSHDIENALFIFYDALSGDVGPAKRLQRGYQFS